MSKSPTSMSPCLLLESQLTAIVQLFIMNLNTDFDFTQHVIHSLFNTNEDYIIC